VTRYLGSMPCTRVRSAGLSDGALLGVSTLLARTGAPSAASTAVAPSAGTLVHSQKRFAMAGINANVWPLSPQDWSSG
jgi:hypothetical protein